MNIAKASYLLFSILSLAAIAIPESEVAACDRNFRACNQTDPVSQRGCLASLRENLKDCIAQTGKDQADFDTILYDKLKEKVRVARGVLDARNQSVDGSGIIIADILAKHEQYFAVVRANYQILMSAFVNNYKPSESDTKRQIELQYENAKSNDRAVLVSSLSKLDEIQRREALNSFQQRSQAELTSKNVADLTQRMKERLAGQVQYIQQNGLADLLEPFSDMKPSIENVKLYLASRQIEFDAKFQETRAILTARLQTVMRLDLEKEVGPTVRESVYLTSVAKFMSEVEASRTLAFQGGTVEGKLGLASFSAQYKNLRKFLDFDSICGGTTKPKWTESGCMRFAQYRAQASRLYNGALGTQMRQNLDMIQEKYPDTETQKIEYIRSLIKDRKFSDAIELYDLLLNSEGLK